MQTFQAKPHRWKDARPDGVKRAPVEASMRIKPTWPTSVAHGPLRQLFVCQYKAFGVLEFKRSKQGYDLRVPARAGGKAGAQIAWGSSALRHNSHYVVSGLPW